jgi:peptidoglycan hydrolase CwlO-like protein
MSRRVSVTTLFGSIVVIILALGIPAGASPSGEIEAKQLQVGAAQANLSQVQTKVEDSYEAYDEAVSRLEKLNREVNASTGDLMSAEKRLVRARGQFENRASQVYKSGNLAFLDVLVGSESFEDFATRLDLWMRLLAEERAQFESVREARDELAEEHEKIEEKRGKRKEAMEEAASQRARATRLFSEAEAYLESVDGELNALVQAEEVRQAEAARQAELAAQAEEREQAMEAIRAAQARELALTRAAQRQARIAARRAERVQAAAAEAEAARAASAREVAERAAAAREAEKAAELASTRQAAAEKAAERREAARETAEQREAAREARRQARISARREARQEEAAEQQAAAAALAEKQAAAEQQAADEATANEQAAIEAVPAKNDQPTEQAEPVAQPEEQPSPEQQAEPVPVAQKPAQAPAEEPAPVQSDPAPAPAPEKEPAPASAPSPEEETAPEPGPVQSDPAPEPAPEEEPAPSESGSCGDDFGGVQPHVAEAGCAVRAEFGIQEIYGVRAGNPGDHGNGLALDFMVYEDTALGDQVADYLLANQEEFGIYYLIWKQRINFGDGWQYMEDRGSPTANHYDHVHASFYSQ